MGFDLVTAHNASAQQWDKHIGIVIDNPVYDPKDLDNLETVSLCCCISHARAQRIMLSNHLQGSILIVSVVVGPLEEWDE